MPLDFENTEVAFRSKTDRELRRSYDLYRLLNSPFLVKAGEWAVKVALALRLPIGPLIRKTIFNQFCGGETIEQCEPVIAELARFGIGTVLDYSVEGTHTQASFDQTAQQILNTVKLAAKNPKIAFCVFKVSGVAPLPILEKKTKQQKLNSDEEDQWQSAQARVAGICELAYANKVKIFIDAEESWIQGAIDDLAEEMMRRFNRSEPLVYNTLQMYRVDRLAYLKDCFRRAEKEGYFLGLKLVRGAYMEKERAHAQKEKVPSPIYPDKESTDRAYDESLKFCAEQWRSIAFCAGTHNEKSTYFAADLAQNLKVLGAEKHIYFCQLLGMGDHLSYNLANEGFPVAKYVPYGPVYSVIPYLFRRAEENTSIRGQTSRELALLKRELKRRERQLPSATTRSRFSQGQ